MKTSKFTPSKSKITEDSKLYAKLSKKHPEGHVMLDAQEKIEFEDWLGVK